MSKSRDRDDLEESTINDHFDRVDRALFDQFLVRLVATFERRAFEKLRAALGEAKSTVQKHYGSSQPFARAAQHLVMSASDFPNLAKLDMLLKSYPRASLEDFHALREHRNYVAHGSRVGVGAPSRFVKIEEVKDMLRQLLQIISKDVPEADESLLILYGTIDGSHPSHRRRARRGGPHVDRRPEGQRPPAGRVRGPHGDVRPDEAADRRPVRPHGGATLRALRGRHPQEGRLRPLRASREPTLGPPW